MEQQRVQMGKQTNQVARQREHMEQQTETIDVQQKQLLDPLIQPTKIGKPALQSVSHLYKLASKHEMPVTGSFMGRTENSRTNLTALLT